MAADERLETWHTSIIQPITNVSLLLYCSPRYFLAHHPPSSKKISQIFAFSAKLTPTHAVYYPIATDSAAISCGILFPSLLILPDSRLASEAAAIAVDCEIAMAFGLDHLCLKKMRIPVSLKAVSKRLALYAPILLLAVLLTCLRFAPSNASLSVPFERAPSLAPPGFRVLNQQAVLETDEGKYLPVYSWDFQSGDFAEYGRACDEWYLQHYPIEQVSEATFQTNCHGWVFGGGLCLLSGEQVKQILIDHNYYPVMMPVPGDAIIYFDDQGGVPHSGIVSSITSDGEVLVESKFGLGARYLHTPEAQPFASSYGFFRTDRLQHAVQLRTFKQYAPPIPNPQP